MRWWLPLIAVTMRIAFDLLAFRVPCVTYEMQKSLIASPLSSLRSPMQCCWWGGSFGVCPKTFEATNAANRAVTVRMVLLPRSWFAPKRTTDRAWGIGAEAQSGYVGGGRGIWGYSPV